MPRNEEGEFELVLGNRQLLSVFFIVVVLLGVFFVMGYILGKNSSPVGGTDVASVGKPPEPAPGSSPIIIDKSNSKSSATESPRPEPAKAPPPKPEQPKPEPAKAEPARTEPAKPQPKRAEPTPPPTRTASGGDAKVGVPPTGSLFLQVAAVGRAEADVVARVLKGKGYDLWIAPTDKENVHRVLVGPLQKSDLGKTRGELEGLGFKPFPRTY
jgi:cell division septation protein DedD